MRKATFPTTRISGPKAREAVEHGIPGRQRTGKKFLEEYDITYPCDHISNYTDEVVTLSKSAMGYGLPGVSGSF